MKGIFGFMKTALVLTKYVIIVFFNIKFLSLNLIIEHCKCLLSKKNSADLVDLHPFFYRLRRAILTTVEENKCIQSKESVTNLKLKKKLLQKASRTVDEMIASVSSTALK